uniref:Nucleolar protein 10 (Trinotate prediction) n=1 Tax=Henneguya salminicola TaxID=69463 RepID=A0A6G3MET0_HENSL
MALLLNNRFIEIHSQEGLYYRLRIPKTGNDLLYDHYTCDLNISSQSCNIYRLNLEVGQFYQPYFTDVYNSSVLCMNYEYHFLLAGTEKGVLYAFDPRQYKKICSVNLSENFSQVNNYGISAISFRDSINFGVGFENGIIAMYDIRSNSPIIYKDHMYGDPIKKINFINTINGDYIMSCDKHSLKIYNRQTVKMYTTIEPSSPINDFCLYPNSGLILFANESSQSGIYFLPVFFIFFLLIKVIRLCT